MSFEVYLQCFGEHARAGISRAAVRSLFPIVEKESERDYWRVRYDDQNSCHIGVTAATTDSATLQSFYVERPCGDVRLWEALLAAMKMGSVVMFWPGGPPVVADGAAGTDLPADMIAALGSPRTIRSAEELLALLRGT